MPGPGLPRAGVTIPALAERPRYSALPAYREAMVLASGPSLTQMDAAVGLVWRDAAYGRGLIVVNSTYKMVPDADVLYAGDKAWFDQYAVDAARSFRGQVWTGSAAVVRDWPSVRLVRRVSGDVLPQDGICVGWPMGNSGLQAICLAALCGARRVCLLGFDGGPSGGRTHWHEAHHSPLKPCHESGLWPAMFERAAAQLADRRVEVTNCSRQTALGAFKRGSLAEWTSS